MSNLKFTATNIRSFLRTVLSKSMRIRFECERGYMCWQCGMFCPVCLCFCYICANGSRNENVESSTGVLVFRRAFDCNFVYMVGHVVLLCRTKSIVAKI